MQATGCTLTRLTLWDSYWLTLLWIIQINKMEEFRLLQSFSKPLKNSDNKSYFVATIIGK
jgi:hypothetical protein